MLPACRTQQQQACNTTPHGNTATRMPGNSVPPRSPWPHAPAYNMDTQLYAAAASMQQQLRCELLCDHTPYPRQNLMASSASYPRQVTVTLQIPWQIPLAFALLPPEACSMQSGYAACMQRATRCLPRDALLPVPAARCLLATRTTACCYEHAGNVQRERAPRMPRAACCMPRAARLLPAAAAGQRSKRSQLAPVAAVDATTITLC